jgi:GntR family transcriptional regulator
LKSERDRFLHEEWPPLAARLERMDIDIETLLKHAPKIKGES